VTSPSSHPDPAPPAPPAPDDAVLLADGELPPERVEAVLQAIADDPRFAQRARDAQRLRSAVGRVMLADQPECPESLRAELSAIALGRTTAPPVPEPGQSPRQAAADNPLVPEPDPSRRIDAASPADRAAGSGEPSRGEGMAGGMAGGGEPHTASQVAATLPDTDAGVSRWVRWGRWAPLAAAAVLLITALVALNAINRLADDAADAAAGDRLIPAALVERFETRHVRCTRQPDLLYEHDQFPDQITQLPGTLEDRFDHTPAGTLDLTRIGPGFQYLVAGICPIPGADAVHIIYQSDNATPSSQAVADQDDAEAALPGAGAGGVPATLSLWIRPTDPTLALTPGRLYQAADPDTAHPMLLWTDGPLMYYLMGDHPQHVQDAATAITTPAV
jgi:hypothetical protein